VRPVTISLIAGCASALALAVIMLGAYVRLSDAGLGCPDWPGCYGGLAAPSTPRAITAANQAYPERPVHPAKAWKEMAHRYLAGSLGVLVLLLAVAAWRGHRCCGISVGAPTTVLVLVVFQALLGMWTVTLLVKPAIVTAHLIGGLGTLGLLWWISLRNAALWRAPASPFAQRLRLWVWLGLLLVLGQILLGGWTSSNYAALACGDFPSCRGGQWLPPVDFRDAFVIWPEAGVSYEYGVLDGAARTAIHLTHRLGALVVLVYLGSLGLLIVARAGQRIQRNVGLAVCGALLLQIGLGIGNVLGHLPLAVAVAHTGGAALLMLSLVTLLHVLSPTDRADQESLRQPRGSLQTTRPRSY
jgi:heme a synthase